MTIGPRNDDEARVFAAQAFIVDTQFRLHQLLKAKGVSQAELAERLKLTPARVSAMFGPRPNLTLETIGRIFAALGEEATLVSPAIQARLDMLEGRTDGNFRRTGEQLRWHLCNPSSVWSQASSKCSNHNGNRDAFPDPVGLVGQAA